MRKWTSPDGTAEVNKHSPYKIGLPDGGIIELGEDIEVALAFIYLIRLQIQ